MSYKLLCTDMDGTLLDNNNEISKANSDALKLAIEKGVEVAITTGRLYQSAKNYIDLLGIECYVIASNGTYIKHKNGKDVLLEKSLTNEQLIRINKIVTDFNLKFYCNSIKEMFIEENESKHTNLESNGIDYIYCSSIPKKVKELNKKIFRATAIEDTDFEKLLAAKGILKEYPDLEVVNSMPNNFDIMQGNTSKGHAVQALAEFLDIDSEEVMCIGDRENDISMIKYAGLGIAMKNATDELKVEADYITDLNTNSGVALAIHKFIL